MSRGLKHRSVTRSSCRLTVAALLGLLAFAAAGCGGSGQHNATASCPTGTVTFKVDPASLGSGTGKNTTQIVLGVLSGPPANHPDIENGSAQWVCEIERSLLNLVNGTWTASVSGPLTGSCSTTVRAGQASRVQISNGRCTA